MADRSVEVKVSGLRELQQGFKQLHRGLDRSLKTALLPVAESVADQVREDLPRRTGRARASVKAKSSNLGASIAAGGRAAPYYHWLDFGGSVGRGHIRGIGLSGAIRNEPWFQPGRYLYPVISSRRAETAEAALEAVERAGRAADFRIGR